MLHLLDHFTQVLELLGEECEAVSRQAVLVGAYGRGRRWTIR